MDDEKLFAHAVRLLEVQMARYKDLPDNDFVFMITDLLPQVFTAVEEAWNTRRELQEFLSEADPSGADGTSNSGLN